MDSSYRDWDRGLVSYPDPAIEVIDERFKPYILTTAAVERLHTGARWAEGPVWFGDMRSLIWSDIPNNRLLRWSEETAQVCVFRSPSNNTNGNTRDGEGRLVSCEHGTRRVTRTEHNGTVTVLIDHFDGKRLNAPNDVVVRSDGSIWFTDPGYGILMNYEGNRAPFELPTNVYRVDPESGVAAVATNEPEKPNGLCFSPDHSKLYVVDTGASHKPDHPHQILVYDVEDNSRLTNGSVFCDMGPSMSDGIRCDIDGNLWSSAGWAGDGCNGVYVFAPDGDLIGKIHLPETAANLCFGGRKRNRLFIAASQSLYSLYVETQGAQMP